MSMFDEYEEPMVAKRQWSTAEQRELAGRIVRGELDLDAAAAKNWLSVATLEQWIVEYVLYEEHWAGQDVPIDRSFWGRLDALSATTVIEHAHTGRKSCRVCFETEGGGSGQLWIEDGRLVDAVFGELRGDEAAFALLSLEEGTFGIVFGPPADERTIERGTIALLAEQRRRVARRAELLERLEPRDRVLVPQMSAQLHLLTLPQRELMLHFDGHNTVDDALALTDLAPLEALEAAHFLIEESYLVPGVSAVGRAGYSDLASVSSALRMPEGFAGEAGDSGLLTVPTPARAGPSRLVTGVVIAAALVAWVGLAVDELLGAQTLEAVERAQAQVEEEHGARDASRGAAPTREAVERALAVAKPPAPPPAPCPEGMVLIEGGHFFMGSDSEHPAMMLATPAHKVELDSYCVDVHEVTVARYHRCSDVGECERPHRKSFWPRGGTPMRKWKRARAVHAALCNEGEPEREQHPVNCVTWQQASAFCEWEGKRLPTEAEWELAARGRDGRVYPWGDAPPSPGMTNACGSECARWRDESGLPEVGPLFDADDGFPGTAPVGSFPAGATQEGLQDVVGNVFEWTSDRFYEYSFEDTAAVTRDPRGPAEGSRRVIRGGAFNSFMAEHTDPALRFPMDQEAYTHGIGFRCVSPPRAG